MSRLPHPGERARILPSEAMDRIGATGRCGVVLDPEGSPMIWVRLDYPNGSPAPEPANKWDGAIGCTISEVELVEERSEVG